MIDFDITHLVFAAGLTAGVTLDLLLARTLFAPPFRIWPTPEPGSWQSLTFWGLFRGGMVLTFVVAVLDWNSTPLLDWTRFIPGLPLGLIGLFITVCGYFNLGLGNTYCRADGPGDGRPLSLQPQPAIHRLDHWARRPLHRREFDLDGRGLRHDGVGRRGLAQAALRCAVSRLLRADRSLPRHTGSHRSRRAEKALTRNELNAVWNSSWPGTDLGRHIGPAVPGMTRWAKARRVTPIQQRPRPALRPQ
jgi:hypothetical protein